MITTNDEKLADHMKFLVNQARDESKGYYHPEIGFNYRMTNLEASLGSGAVRKTARFPPEKEKIQRNIQRDTHKHKGNRVSGRISRFYKLLVALVC